MSRATPPLTVRPAGEQDLDAILDLLTEYGFPRAYFAPYYTGDPSFRPEQSWLVEREGQVVAHLRVFERNMRVSGTTLRVAGIGNVITTVAERGQGHAGKLLRAIEQPLADQGFAYSVLWTHLPDLYGRYGWAPIGQTRIRILTPSASDRRGEVSHFGFRDLPEIMRCYEVANANRSGTFVRSSEYWRGQITWLGESLEDFLLLRQDGRLAGYIRGKEQADEVEVLELATCDGDPSIARSLVGALAEQSRRVAQAVLPPSLRAAWASTECEAEDVPGLMGRVIKVDALIAELGQLWRDRAEAAQVEGSFALRTHTQSVRINIEAGQLRTVPARAPTPEQGTELDEGEFAHLLLHGWDSAAADLLGDRPNADLLRVIFPVQDFVVWPADAF